MALPYRCATFCFAALLLGDLTTFGEMSPAAYDNTINNLYDAMLQREYAGPVVFQGQVERKAQRSPSLRLRFGRRSDPSMQAFMPLEKRWFGEVNQKPIRSPSLRLRFGRRSDPSMPLHTSMDHFISNNNKNNNYDDTMPDDAFERLLRKPQRLRWGRSLAYAQNTYTNDNNDMENLQRGRDVIDTLLNSARVRNVLMNLRQFEENDREADNETDNENEEATVTLNNDDKVDYDNNINTMDYNNTNINNLKTNDDMEFQREVKKNGMRLRFGRSIGKPMKKTTTTTADKHLIKPGMK